MIQRVFTSLRRRAWMLALALPVSATAYAQPAAEAPASVTLTPVSAPAAPDVRPPVTGATGFGFSLSGPSRTVVEQPRGVGGWLGAVVGGVRTRTEPQVTAVDEAQMVRLLEPSCASGVQRSCAALGYLLSRTGSHRRDINRGASLLATACDSGSAFACRVEPDTMPPYPAIGDAGATPARAQQNDEQQRLNYARNSRALASAVIALMPDHPAAQFAAADDSEWQRDDTRGNGTGGNGTGGNGTTRSAAQGIAQAQTAPSQTPPSDNTSIDWQDAPQGIGFAHIVTQPQRRLANGTVIQARSTNNFDEARIFALLDPSCRAGDQRSCAALGHFLQRVEGPLADGARGTALIASACSAGNSAACDLQNPPQLPTTALLNAPPERAARLRRMWARSQDTTARAMMIETVIDLDAARTASERAAAAPGT
jgi:hypothetical protein